MFLQRFTIFILQFVKQWLMALFSTRVIKSALIQIENYHYALLKWITKVNVLAWFCGRNHHKYEEFCTIITVVVNFAHSENANLIFWKLPHL